MKIKYDWSKVPKGINFIATDKNNRVYGYYNKPIKKDGAWSVGKYDIRLVEQFIKLPNIRPYTKDWNKSLEERPAA